MRVQGQRNGMGVQEQEGGERFCGSWEADLQVTQGLAIPEYMAIMSGLHEDVSCCNTAIIAHAVHGAACPAPVSKCI